MKIITINDIHFQLEMISAFKWGTIGRYTVPTLTIWLHGHSGCFNVDDGNRKWYLMLCDAMGVEPVEENDD